MAMGMTEDDRGVIWSVSYPNNGVVSFDPAQRKVVHEQDLDGSFGPTISHQGPRVFVVAPDGRIFVFGHVGGDNAYGATDQSIVMDSFRLRKE